MANSSSKQSRNSTKESTSPVKAYHCTGCKKNITSTYNAHLHPLIGCLVCRSCYVSYGNGDFSSWADGVDDKGDDNYCRWCVDGGELYGCSTVKGDESCHYSFCQECIERNAPDDELNTNGDEKTQWYCFACDTTKLAKLREWSVKALKDLTLNSNLKTGDTSNPKPKSRKSEQSSEVLSETLNSSSKNVDKNDHKQKKRKSEPSTDVVNETFNPISKTGDKDSHRPKSRKSEQSTEVPSETLISISKNGDKNDQRPKNRKSEQNTEVPSETLNSIPKNGDKNDHRPKSRKSEQSNEVPSETLISISKNVDKNDQRPKNRKSEQNTEVPSETLNSIPKNGDKIDHRPKNRKSEQGIEVLNESELKTRLEVFNKTKSSCIAEIDCKFANLLEMFTSAEIAKNPKRKDIIAQELASIRETMMEFETMMTNLENLR